MNKKIMALVHTLSHFIKFLATGGLNTIFGFLLFFFFSWINLPTWLALILSYIFGILFNFITFGSLVFKNMRVNQIPRFVIVYLLLFSINLTLIEFLEAWMNIGKILAQLIICFPLATVSYMLNSKWVFRKNF